MVNFVILCTDQQRADSLGCAGNREAHTPNLDALAARGTRFTRHYTPNQICCPSRGTMITGLYPRHHGMTTNGRTLHDGLETLPGVLGRAGWDTHAVGKLHLQPIMAGVEHRMPESVPFWQAGLGRDWHGPYFGYRTVDFMIGESLLATEGGHYAAWLREEYPEILPLYQPDAALDGPLSDLDEAWVCAVPAELHYNTWIAERAVAFLERARPPFLLFVSSPDPHHPFSPPRPWADRFDAARMPLPERMPGELGKLAPFVAERPGLEWIDNTAPAVEQGGMASTAAVSDASLRRAIALTRGMEAMIDDAFGKVLGALERMGHAAETVVVFTSDHGEFLGRHGLLHKGPPPFGDLNRVSMMMAGPGRARSGVPRRAQLPPRPDAHAARSRGHQRPAARAGRADLAPGARRGRAATRGAAPRVPPADPGRSVQSLDPDLDAPAHPLPGRAGPGRALRSRARPGRARQRVPRSALSRRTGSLDPTAHERISGIARRRHRPAGQVVSGGGDR